MNRQSVFFLQAMWELGVEKDDIIALSKENIRYEIERGMRGVLHPETIWVSDEAKKLKQRLLLVKERMEALTTPYQLLEITEQYKEIMDEIQTMQIRSVQTLNADTGPMVSELHILVRQLFPLALAGIKEQVNYELYRLLTLSGRLDYEGIELPGRDVLQDWLEYYKNRLRAVIDQFNVDVLRGCWAYEKRKVAIHEKIYLTQFIAVPSREGELLVAPGEARCGTGDEGVVRIYGRGYLTNLTPKDMVQSIGSDFRKHLLGERNFSQIDDEDGDPIEILNRYFGAGKYVVSAEEYFRFINVFLIIKEFRGIRQKCEDE